MDWGLVWIGCKPLHNVILATNTWQRLRGWYGYQQLPVNGVLLTRCSAVHTLAMPLHLDLLWINRDSRCIQVQRSVPAWRFAWCFGASHVLELREGVLNEMEIVSDLLGQTLSWAPQGRSETTARYIRSHEVDRTD